MNVIRGSNSLDQNWERADLLALLCMMFYLFFCHFHMICPGSGVVLDYIIS